MRSNPKHRSDNDSNSGDEGHNEFVTKKEIHHHRRKHKKHKHKDDDLDHVNYKNGYDEGRLRSEVIEIHGSSSEDDCRNGTRSNDCHVKRTGASRSRHHVKEERRHKKRRKRSLSHSESPCRDRDMESRPKKSRGEEERNNKRESDSDEYQHSNSHRKRRSRESSASRNKETNETHRGDEKSRSDSKGKIKYKIDVDKIKKEGEERWTNKKSLSEGSKRKNPEEPSGSRNTGRKRGSKERDVHEWGDSGANKSKTTNNAGCEVQKPNFGLSGKLTEDTNMYNGVVIKYSEPPEARMPKKRWRLYPFKGDQALPPLYIHRQSAYLLGRDRKVVDMPIDHPSCSKQHAALQYRLITYERANGSVGKQIRLYIIDLESANGTFINNKKIEPRKYVELFEKDVIKFGFSSREYVLLHEHSKDDNPTPEDSLS